LYVRYPCTAGFRFQGFKGVGVGGFGVWGLGAHRRFHIHASTKTYMPPWRAAAFRVSGVQRSGRGTSPSRKRPPP